MTCSALLTVASLPCVAGANSAQSTKSGQQHGRLAHKSLSRTCCVQLGVVAPSALPAFAKLPASCTSLDIHGDHWEFPALSKAQLSHLGRLSLQHLGIFHFSLGPDEDEPESGVHCEDAAVLHALAAACTAVSYTVSSMPSGRAQASCTVAWAAQLH